MKIKLIMAASESEPIYKHNPLMPLALGLLAAAAPEHDYTIIDLTAAEPIDFDESVDLVGISVRYRSEEKAYQIADTFRKKGVRVVLGGPQVSAKPFEAITHADAVVIGEGEELWPKLLIDYTQKSLKQFYVCSPSPFPGSGYSVHQIQKHLDLAAVNPPLRNLTRNNYIFDTVFASRGCPIDCDFCAVPSLFGKTFRTRPVADVVAEIQTFKNYYYLIDDSVFGKPSTYDYYSSLYHEIGRLKKKRYWMGQANLDAAADRKGQEVIKKARQAGLLYASVGIESINPAVLQKSGALRKMGAASAKNVIEKIKDNIRFIQDAGIIVSGWFVVGYEEDSIDTYYQSLKFCEQMNILPAILPLNALPGTRLYEKLSKEEKLITSPFSNISHPHIQHDDLKRALKHTLRKGYSFRRNLKRIGFYLPRFQSDRIHKIIFLHVLQTRFKHSIDITARQ